jgi:hypothetical protein
MAYQGIPLLLTRIAYICSGQLSMFSLKTERESSLRTSYSKQTTGQLMDNVQNYDTNISPAGTGRCRIFHSVGAASVFQFYCLHFTLVRKYDHNRSLSGSLI